MSGALYIVGTPIGNLGDITYRAVETLKNADFICAEDTRVTLRLLNRYEIKKRIISFHEHTPESSLNNIVAKILAGESCALVSDAGMPCISDPGEELIGACVSEGIEVTTVPGPSAFVAALALSGITAARFSFEGFLSVTKKQRRRRLEETAEDTRTLVFYEAPHKLLATLKDMLSYFGDRKIAVCREMTKIHEEVLRMSISEAISHFEEFAPRGEFVIVVSGKKDTLTEETGAGAEEAAAFAAEMINGGARPADAAKEAAKTFNLKKGDVYSELMKIRS